MTMLCDFYELTMGNGYLKAGFQDRITYFDVYFRSVPDGGGYAIAAGLDQFGLAVVSLVCCALQFWLGRKIGRHYNDAVSAGQALGQKNTVLAIWMGYTFFTPVTAVAAGFYSVWHNVVNSWQLYQQRKKEMTEE